MEKIETLKQWIQESNRIVFFGGAGVSTESGIPDFRSVDGLYSQKFDYPPETIISHSFYERKPEYFFRFYREKMLPLGFEPNVTHKVLARWEKEGKLSAVVTQNIDGLHQKAGSKNVYELHGTTWRNYCSHCKRKYPSDYLFESKESVPKCDCGGMVRPYVTLYEEGLPEDAVSGAIHAISNADMLIIGGTSLRVYPAASYVHYFKGKHLVVINREELDVKRNGENDLFICGSLGEVFSKL